jgi:hypothetical protein
MRRAFLVLLLFSVPPAATAGQGNAAPAWPGEAEGFGLTVEDAKHDALKHLVGEMIAFLRNQDPPLVTWRPTVDYVKRHVIEGNGASGKDVDVEGVGTSKRWIYPVKPLDLSVLRALDEEARRAERRPERMVLATQFFGGLALVLAALAGYSRLRGCAKSR